MRFFVTNLTEGALSTLEDFSAQFHAIENTESLPADDDGVGYEKVEHRSIFVQPVFSDVTDSSSIVTGLVHGLFGWSSFLRNILPSDAKGVSLIESRFG